ncbi:MAG: VWA domain-containing protein [Myxococcales bacterium]|nr:VWA domain-containing protein [Myxococcales bacterium]
MSPPAVGAPVDPRAWVRILVELCSVLRRRGLPVAPPEVIDAARALSTIGLGDRAEVHAALAACLVKRAADRPVFDEVFSRFFDAHTASPVDLLERLRLEGFTEAELAVLSEILAAQAEGSGIATLVGLSGGADLTRLLRGPELVRALEGLTTQLQIGFYTQRALDHVGMSRARAGLGALRTALRGALGERGDELATRLEQELERTRLGVRDHVRDELLRRTLRPREDQRQRLEHLPFTSLSDEEVAEVRRAVRRLAEKLRGKARVRRRHAETGAIDVRRTLRASWRTLGVPVAPQRRKRRPDRPKLVVLCDVSDSVRLAARFMLELVYALQELFADTRSFVFVSELGEVTKLFAKESVSHALARVFAGEAVSLTDNSNYGRVLARFHREHLGVIDRRTTVVVIGDGRNNYQADEAWALEDVRRRARALLWINPERRGSWSIGDSAMNAYAPRCTRVLEVACAAELEAVARLLVAL